MSFSLIANLANILFSIRVTLIKLTKNLINSDKKFLFFINKNKFKELSDPIYTESDLMLSQKIHKKISFSCLQTMVSG
jgi:hypothetical protein